MAAKYPTNALVPPKSGAKALLAVGEAPGSEESQIGEPFVGKSGAWLDSWFDKVGVKRRDLWMTNVISCRPENNKFPTTPDARKYISLEDGRAAVAHCRANHLEPFLRTQEWEKVYLIGSQALRALTGKDSMNDWGGTPLAIPSLDPERKVAIGTIHPAALMRDPSMLPIVFCDLKRPLVGPPENYSLDAAPSALKQLYGRPFVVDIETDVPPTRIHMFGISASSTYAVCMPHAGEYIGALHALLAQAKEVVTQNGIQFDIPQLRKHGAPLSMNPDSRTDWDIMLMHALLWPTLPHDLGMIARQYLNKPYWKGWRAAGDTEELYCARDADGEWQIFERLKRELEQQPRLRRLYLEVQVPLARICHLMTETGIMTDPAAAQRVANLADQTIVEQEVHLPAHMRAKMLTKRKRVAAPAGTLTPPKFGKKGQLLKQKPVKWLFEPYEVMGPSPWVNGPRTGKYLYDELGLKEQLDVKGARTTGKKALAVLGSLCKRTASSFTPQVSAITTLRVWNHRKGICKKLSKGAAQRVHASFNPHGTNTGRLSSTGGTQKIQMQNITESMRVLFVPSQPGWKLWSADYINFEGRLSAWFAKDTERMARINTPGYNEYKHAASIFLGIPAEDVKKDHSPDSPYHQAKQIVLGNDRALGSRKISITNDIPEGEVKEMQRKWRALIPKTMDWQKVRGDEAKREKFLFNPFGRRGLFYGPGAYTEGISFDPQSTGGDIIFRSMIALMYKRIDWPLAWVQRVAKVIEPLPEPARLLLQVHDELVGECPAEQIDEVRETVTRVMSQPWAELGGLTLPVNFAYGENWMEMESE